MSDDSFRDPLIRCLETAAEQMRQANHQTYIAREVTDLYAAFGALHDLFSRFDQLAGYLQRTLTEADPVDFRHDDECADVAVVLTAVIDGIARARDCTAQSKRSLATGWAQLSCLVLDIPDLVCPECGEPAHRGTPTDLTPMQRTAGIRPRYRHADGTQLCPVVGPHGYQPAPPHAPDSPSPTASPIPSPNDRDEPDPEGQH